MDLKKKTEFIQLLYAVKEAECSDDAVDKQMAAELAFQVDVAQGRDVDFPDVGVNFDKKAFCKLINLKRLLLYPPLISSLSDSLFLDLTSLWAILPDTLDFKTGFADELDFDNELDRAECNQMVSDCLFGLFGGLQSVVARAASSLRLSASD